MKVYLFNSDREPSVSAFTSDESGRNLPAHFAPWRPLNGGKGLYLGSASDPIADAIRIDGYHLVRRGGERLEKRQDTARTALDGPAAPVSFLHHS